jgi:hypothetical protein
MATQTRGCQTMSTEPNPPDAPPRPKGFVRRNLDALVVLAVVTFLFFANTFARIPLWKASIAVKVYGGILAEGVSDFNLGSRFTFRMERPEIGTGPWEYPLQSKPFYAKAGIIVRLWIPFLCFSLLIAFREWRRQRAASRS